MAGTLKTRNGRPEMSTDAATSASSMGTKAVPYRTMPRLSAIASRKARPSTIPTSSTVWWRSTSVSPCASTVRSMNPCFDHAASM